MVCKNEMVLVRKSIEEIVEAIHSVIQADVTVIDNEYNRIAATGQYVNQIDTKVAVNSVFYKALKTGEEFIVESPREEQVCFDCKARNKCTEYAEVCCPIFINDSVIGIIGLVAFDEIQKKEILSNKMNLLNFLRKMAELISSKILENRTKEILIAQSKQIEILFNSIDNAVISVNTKGIIQRSNCNAKNMFNIGERTTIFDINSELKLLNLLSNVNNSGKFEKRFENRLSRYVYNSKPIIINGNIDSIVFTISKEKDLIDAMNDIVNVSQRITFDEIIGDSNKSIKLKESALKSAKSCSTVLILGESGTGKELFARAIHNASDRKNMPFVPVNCAAIPENLIESELFGYNEGAFTGALKGGKPGKFEIADKGTIFLDEIGDMPIHLQTKLLRVLQEREVERVGGKYATPVDIRVIAATHQNLEKLIEEKRFREDLFYRLNVIPITLLPLREKIEDIDLLAITFLNRYNEKLNKNILSFDEYVLNCFKSYLWKGNIREMKNVIEYAVNMCEEDIIGIKHIPNYISNIDSTNTNEKDLSQIVSLAQLEKIEIKKALKKYGNKKEGINKIVELLGISRATLYRKIKEYKL